MRKFDSEVQHIKYKVLFEIVKRVLNGTFELERYKIPKVISPGPFSKIRCCIYKERAIVEERIEYVVNGIKDKNIVEVIGIACDECPVKRFIITEACRGCLAHKCIQACPKAAIDIIDGRARINQEKCIECGKCKDVCPFNAISDVMRPCKKACGSKAIDIDENKRAKINRDRCTNCGACAFQCPFGAITDRSDIVSVVEELKKASKNSIHHFNEKEEPKRIYAMIAPAIAGQFPVKIEKINNGLKKMGFHEVVEVALGADIVVKNEAFEFIEKVIEKGEKALLSSCCPAFVAHVKKNYPELVKYISSMVSPMTASGRYIKKIDKNSVTVFIGPCIAKKSEAKDFDSLDAVDYVITFEELEAMFDAFEIKLDECKEEFIENGSYFGRIFGKSGGLAEAVKEVLKENNLEKEELRPDNLMKMRYRNELYGNTTEKKAEIKPIICDGIAECDKALIMLKFGKLDGNFIEGMACKGGCIGGAAALSKGLKEKSELELYANNSEQKNIEESIKRIDIAGIDFHRHEK